MFRFRKKLVFPIALFLIVNLVVLYASTVVTEEPEPMSYREELPETQPATVPVTIPETIPVTQPETIPETQPETVPTEPERVYLTNGVPLYFQTDYPNVMYGNGTIESSGCSIVSLAMVASYLTGHDYKPDELADWFGGYIGTNVERMEHASNELRLPWRRAVNWIDARSAIEKGAVVIVMEDYRSIFTDSQHFIVVTGLTPDGRVMVNDSYEPNYDKWNLEDGFANGFTQEQICYGYSGAWIYNKAAMAKEPFIYEPEEEPYVEPRYPDIHLSSADMELMARVVWVEARGEDRKGQQAVAEVILNRLAMENYADNVYDVIHGEERFRSAPYLDEAEPTQTQYEAVEQALRGPYVLPMDVTYFSTKPVDRSYWGVIGGHIFYREKSD